MPKDCDLIQAMERTGITPPSYMLEDYNKEEIENDIDI